MKRAAIVLNVVSITFTLLVMATDGPATRAADRVFGLMLLAIPAFNVFALARGGDGYVAHSSALLNVALLGAVVWALVDQHPHPGEPGFVPYAVLVVLTPVLSVVTLLRVGRGGGPVSRAAAGGVASGRRPAAIPTREAP